MKHITASRVGGGVMDRLYILVSIALAAAMACAPAILLALGVTP